MSFILNLFSSQDTRPTLHLPLSSPTSRTTYSSSSTPVTITEKQNAAALKVLLKRHKHILRTEYSLLVMDYKQALDYAAQEYKRARKQAELTLQRRSEEAVRRQMEIIAASEEVLRADDKTKAVFLKFQKEWMGAIEEGVVGGIDTGTVSTIGGESVGTYERDEEMAVMPGLGTIELEGFMVQDTAPSQQNETETKEENDDRDAIRSSPVEGRVTFAL
ncbi:hypothetical protein FBU30_001429 [Linnemannia zychae]|nr:hypothetical protein FBU30_001429 [Linnemannia zychae]